MKTNERKIAFISFHFLFRIGTFQWVTADSNKKFPSAISGCARRFEVNFRAVCFLLVGSLSTAGFDPATANGIAQFSIFAKVKKIDFCWRQFRVEPGRRPQHGWDGRRPSKLPSVHAKVQVMGRGFQS
jgi:hypothetical protein